MNLERKIVEFEDIRKCCVFKYTHMGKCAHDDHPEKELVIDEFYGDCSSEYCPVWNSLETFATDEVTFGEPEEEGD